MKPSPLAMTELESETESSGIGILEIQGYFYKATDIEEILWDNTDGSQSSNLDEDIYSYLDAETFTVVLVDGTELNLTLSDENTNIHMLYEAIDTM